MVQYIVRAKNARRRSTFLQAQPKKTNHAGWMQLNPERSREISCAVFSRATCANHDANRVPSGWISGHGTTHTVHFSISQSARPPLRELQAAATVHSGPDRGTFLESSTSSTSRHCFSSVAIRTVARVPLPSNSSALEGGCCRDRGESMNAQIDKQDAIRTSMLRGTYCGI